MIRGVLDLFPESAAFADGGPDRRRDPRHRHSRTSSARRSSSSASGRCTRRRARTGRRRPDALVVYGSKAFPNLALLRLFAEEGLGADVSTLGELELARRAGTSPASAWSSTGTTSPTRSCARPPSRSALVVLDAPDEVERAAEAGVRRVLVRVTAGIEADTHESIRTGHHGSKFGLPPEDALDALRRAQAAGLDAAGLHVHIGSQLLDTQAARMTVEWLGAFAADCRAELGGWEAGGGRPRRRPGRAPRARRAGAGVAGSSASCCAGSSAPWDLPACRRPLGRPRARALARRARGRRALPRRRGQARERDDDLRGRGRRDVRQPAPAALRGALHGGDRGPAPRRRPSASTPSPARTATGRRCSSVAWRCPSRAAATSSRSPRRAPTRWR